jgi:CMP-N-acetylneuraminic acid synthetase
VPFLRNEHFDDLAPVSAATLSFYLRIKNELCRSYDIIVQLMPNCPNRSSTDICNCIDFFVSSGSPFLISSFKYGFSNPWWAHELAANGSAKPLFGAMMSKRSQDLPTLYCPTGAIWVAQETELIRYGTFYGDGYRFFPLSLVSSVDIDDYEDLAMAKALKSVHRENSGSGKPGISDS